MDPAPSRDPGPAVDGASPPSRRGPALAWVVALLAVAFCATVRIAGTLGDESFQSGRPNALLRSDPGLLYYITESIVEADGAVPADFRSDPNVQHPDRVDLARMFTVGQEFLVAWAYLAFGGETPLHVFCVWYFSVLAALTALACFGVTYELTGRFGWAALAALFYASLPVNFRTTGFILIREDLSFPLFAAHLWALARLTRRPSVGTAGLAGLLLTLALATWHAMGFVVALEVAALTGWYLFSGQPALRGRSATVLIATTLLGSLLVPVLRAKVFLLSAPVLLLAALVGCQRLSFGRNEGGDRDDATGRGVGALASRALAWLGSAALVVGAAWGAGRVLAGAKDYSHVLGLLTAKLTRFGQLPADPTELPFDVRLLWQGPFSTAFLQDFTLGMPHALAGTVLAFGTAAFLARRGRLDPGFGVLLLLLSIGLVSGWLIRRTLIIPGLLAPIATVTALARLELSDAGKRLAKGALVAVSLAGAAFVAFGITRASLLWYAPPARAGELVQLTEWVEENLPGDAAVLGDFVASTAILAHSGNPIALQPKYETRETRRRIERFYTTFARGTPAELRELARELDCQYLLVDTEILWWSGRFVLGVPAEQQVPEAGTCAYYFANRNPAALTGVPGFELLYRSPPELGLDLFRVYRIR